MTAADLRSSSAPTPAQALAHVDAALALHQEAIRELMMARAALQLLCDYADIDARHDAEWGVKRC